MPALLSTVPIRRLSVVTLFAAASWSLAACAGDTTGEHATAGRAAPATAVAGTALTMRDTVIDATIEASGVAEPALRATLSTKLMGTVTAVLVHEGDRVRAGQPMVRIDARDLTAKSAQVGASMADAEAMQREAARQVARFRALYADSAATRAQLDAAETGLARADAAVRAAGAAAGELDAVRSYATITAPFSGMITMRAVDPGSFAAPGAPLLAIEDASTLRLRVSAAGDAVRRVARGQALAAVIDGASVTATVEGIVPAGAGNLFTINATVGNRDGALRGGSAASVSIPVGEQRVLLVPNGAVVREGDLTGVVIRTAAGDERRWVQLGAVGATHTIVTSGLRAGDTIVVPTVTRRAPAAS